MFNYIKAHRKNWGLTQRELGYLIGFGDNSRICQIEQGKVTPTFAESVIFELLFEKSNSRLFPDFYYDVSASLDLRLELLAEHFAELSPSEQTEEMKRRIKQIRRYLQAINEKRI